MKQGRSHSYHPSANRSVLPPVLTMSVIALLATPSNGMFQHLETESITPCHHKLTKVPDIPYKCWQFKDPNAKLPVWESSLGFEFGKLTHEQWQKIAIAYATWRIPKGKQIADILPPFNPHHSYWLMDFMPPIMQAVNRHRFIQQTRTVPDHPHTSSIVSNCWGTLYEIYRLRAASPLEQSYLMMVDAQTILNTFQSLSSPTLIPETGDFLFISHQHSSATQKNSPSHSHSSEPSHQTYLDHTALFIDSGILFEKAGAGDHVPYRLIGLSTLQKIWRRDVFHHSIHRPNHSAKIPHPLSFRIEHQSSPLTTIADADPKSRYLQHYAIIPLPPLLDTQGRMSLAPQLYHPSSFQTKFLDQHDRSKTIQLK